MASARFIASNSQREILKFRHSVPVSTRSGIAMADLSMSGCLAEGLLPRQAVETRPRAFTHATSKSRQWSPKWRSVLRLRGRPACSANPISRRHHCYCIGGVTRWTHSCADTSMKTTATGLSYCQMEQPLTQLKPRLSRANGNMAVHFLTPEGESGVAVRTSARLQTKQDTVAAERRVKQPPRNEHSDQQSKIDGERCPRFEHQSTLFPAKGFHANAASAAQAVAPSGWNLTLGARV
jgi:hypothetical protein